MRNLLLALILACNTTVPEPRPDAGAPERAATMPAQNAHYHTAPGFPPHFAAANISVTTFLTSGTYTPQPGVFSVEVCGWGGGGGGGGGGTASAGNTTSGGGGGGGAIASCWRVAVTPGTGITVTIGAGGGGAGAAETAGVLGGDSTFGSLADFAGASGGGAGSHNTLAGKGGAGGAFVTGGGASVACVSGAALTASATINLAVGPCGGFGGSSGVPANSLGAGGVAGDQQWFAPAGSIAQGGAAGALGTGASTTDQPGAGGGGGGGGPGGAGTAGAQGGAGNTGGTGGNGGNASNASANTGAGGGGGGGGGIGTTGSGTGGTGGNGGSGEIIVYAQQ